MQEAFVGDTVILVVKSGIDLTDEAYDSVMIKYKKPDGTTGEFTATVSAENDEWAETTLGVEDLDQPGEWVLQVCVKDDADTVILHGKFIVILVKEPITIDVE